MKDQTTIMATVLQVSAAIAALLLVFQGYYLSTLSSLPATAQPAVKRPYKNGVVYSLIALALSVLVALSTTAWLIGLDLFWLTIVGFVLSMVSVTVLSITVAISAVRN